MRLMTFLNSRNARTGCIENGIQVVDLTESSQRVVRKPLGRCVRFHPGEAAYAHIAETLYHEFRAMIAARP